MYTPQDFGARADGATLDTAAIQQAIDACTSAGGGTVYLGPGKYLTGPIYLKSNVTFHLEAGATVLGSTNRADYGTCTRRYAGTTQLTLEALVQAVDAERITLAGRGVIDGQGEAFWKPIRDYYATPKGQRPPMEEYGSEEEQVRNAIWHRPRLLELVGCRNLILEGVTLQNSGFWNGHMIYCENAKLNGLTFHNPPWGCNGDGMNLNSSHDVMISNCRFDVNDDAICLKSGWDEDGRRIGIATRNVTVANCVVHRGHGGVVIGSDMSGGVQNVAVTNCVFDGTEIGIRMKSMRGRGGLVENINVNNVVMDGVPQPFVFNLRYWKPMPPEPVSERTPVFRNVRFSQIDAVNAKNAGFIDGLEEMPVRNIRFESVRIQSREPMTVRHAQGLEFRNVRLECAQAPEMQLEDVSDVEIDRVQMRGDHAPAPSIQLTDARQVFVHDSSATCSGGTLLDCRNTPESELRLADNDAR